LNTFTKALERGLNIRLATDASLIVDYDVMEGLNPVVEDRNLDRES
jgi:hypothetical protein